MRTERRSIHAGDGVASRPPRRGHLRWWWGDRRVYEYFAVNVGPWLGWRDPILIYQMGKVGSSSIRNSLFRCTDPGTKLVLMSHEFLPPRERDLARISVEPGFEAALVAETERDRQIYQGLPLRARLGWRFREKFYTEKIYRNFVRRGHVRVITLVREPIATNISMFFQLLDHYLRARPEVQRTDVPALRQLFLRQYNHARPLIWFDAELKATLGVDVYAHPFPQTIGHQRISTEQADVLILKSEVDDEVKSRAIADFLGLDKLELVRSNVAEDKSYAGVYGQFKRQIRLPGSLLSRMYGSRYARHFYSAAELARFRERWGGEREQPGDA